MQFHHHGYVSADPRVQPAAGTGIDRPAAIPDEVDVLIVGGGPAGMLLAAQLSQFPDVVTRLVERRPGRLAIGQADGIQARSVETFQAFGFAESIVGEAYRITEMAFWAPDPAHPERIHRAAVEVDDPHGISEFPHLIVNQARVLDHFAEVALDSAGRIAPDFGVSFLGLTVGDGERPVAVRLDTPAGERTIRARYVVGCDGARSRVREAIGRRHEGAQALHAWGVMDALAVTDFPDIRTKCAIQSEAGSILLIPREGGYLFRMYVDLGEVTAGDAGAVRATPLPAIIDRANAILSPYRLDVKDVAWWSVYEVGHRVTDAFDDTSGRTDAAPHVFICGDACHTHSAKAGQGMNVSMQDGFNLGWKLGHVITGLAPESLLATYSAERQRIARDLIEFDRTWSSMMARRPDESGDPQELARFYTETAEFPAGFRTQYGPSAIVGDAQHQALAAGFPVGKRFRSALVSRVCDGNPVQLGHHARADGRWRVYAFEGADPSSLIEWAARISAPGAFPAQHTPSGADPDAVFDIKAVHRRPHGEVDLGAEPGAFLPRVGPFALIDYEKVYALHPGIDVFAERGIGDEGAVVVVRPDQYVAAVLPFSAADALDAFFEGALTRRAVPVGAA